MNANNNNKHDSALALALRVCNLRRNQPSDSPATPKLLLRRTCQKHNEGAQEKESLASIFVFALNKPKGENVGDREAMTLPYLYKCW